MDCPLKTREGTGQLLDFCSGESPAGAGPLAQHIAHCAECREFASRQQSVWEAMDAWKAPAVSADFDRRLYTRLEAQASWWERLVLSVRRMSWGHAIPGTALAGVVLAAGFLLLRPDAPPIPSRATIEPAKVESIRPEQVEYTLDTMDVLNEFSRQADSPQSKL
jgi:hypothetical protein